MTRHKRLALIPTAASVIALAAGCSSAAPRLTFDGDTCDYAGSGTLSAGPTEITFDNQSGEFAALALIELPAEEARRTQALDLVGEDMAISDSDDVVVAGVIMAGPGEEITEHPVLQAGGYVVDCTTFTGDQPSHAWRAAAIDVE